MSRASAWKGFAAGAAGGLLATVVMDAFQKASIESTRATEKAAGSGQRLTEEQEQQLGNYEKAHSQVVDRVADAAGASLTASQKKVAAPATHYIFGALAGGVYGLLAEYWKPATFGFGTAFGASLYLGASEAVLPSLDLLPTPAETPAFLHVGGLLAHAVYGASTEGVRLLVREQL